MSKTILSELPELFEAGVISPKKAAKIEAYYDTGTAESQNKLFVSIKELAKKHNNAATD